MEYREIANLLDDASSIQPSKFKTKNWAEVNDESRGTYNVNNQIKFKTKMHTSLLRELLLLMILLLLLLLLLQLILIKK